MHRIKFLLSTFCVAAILAGCVGGETYRVAITVLPYLKAGNGRIFAYRNHTILSTTVRRVLFLDGKPVGDVLNGKSIYVDAKAGKHVVTYNGGRNKLNINVVAGKNLYLRFDIVRDEVAVGNTTVTETRGKTAKREIEQTNLIETMVRHPDEL